MHRSDDEYRRRDNSSATKRRDILLRGAALLAGGLAATVPAATTANAQTSDGGRKSGQRVTSTYRGHSPFGFDQWASVEFNVPEGVRRISVSASFEAFVVVPGVMSNVLDLGLFGPMGFRGWSGGARQDFTVSPSDATPGYVPGAITAGLWSVALGPIVYHPKGMKWEVRITLEYGEPGDSFRPHPAPEVALGRGYTWYRGDMHLHTEHSDGRRSPGQLVDAARDRQLDFIASTEHNTSSASLSWGRYARPDLLILNGEEVTTRHGHWLAVGLPPAEWVEWRYGPHDKNAFAQRSDRVRSLGGLVVVAHPMTPGPGSLWKFGFDKVDALEVWSGPWTLDDAAAVAVWDGLLRAGRRITAVGNSDAHSLQDVVGLPQTVVRASSLSRAKILGAVRRGAAYLAESANVVVDLSAVADGRRAGLGEELPVSAFESVRVTARINGAPGTTATMHTAWGVMASTKIGGDGSATLEWTGWGKASRFARVEVRRLQPGSTTLDQMVALTNPVWFG
ncbi:CehA/McbA family metallohydrolase [Streptomyces sp. NPDC127178]|uniref:CehA/McbA family metallohydrolase n=1 Tax=unclassified Streptomyces TaxID=2593676 RepID=UPI003633E6EA